MKYILITGSPVNGFIYEGPFDDPIAAGDFARETSHRNSKYWIAPIREPEEDNTFHYRPDSARLEWKVEGKDRELCKIVEDHLEGKEIHHKDGDPRNYSIDNLELVSIKDHIFTGIKNFDDLKGNFPIQRSRIKDSSFEIFDIPEQTQRLDWWAEHQRIERKIAQSDKEKAEISMLKHGIDPDMMCDIDPADTESYAASLPGIDYHDILDQLDEEDIPL